MDTIEEARLERRLPNVLQAPDFDPELIRRFDRNGPRYTSYPTADRFVETFDSRRYAAWAARRSDAGRRRPLSLYVHLPFCHSPCYFCACNKIVTTDPAKALRYMSYLSREIALQAALFRDDPRVQQMHWGGGTPTLYGTDDLGMLFENLCRHFDFAPDGEYSIEVDPRTVAPAAIAELRQIGFNRLSFGVQDFEPEVQQAIHRVQAPEEVERLMAAARASGFESINVDLIYGLPRQTVVGFARTLERVAAARPDRIAVYSYAHLPARFNAQKQISEADLPSADVKLRLLGAAVERLSRAGYVYIGMDHFGLPTDALAVAQMQGRLHRNFQGYSTHSDCDLVGMGVSAISAVGPTYSQNARTLSEYYGCLDRNDLPIVRGIELSRDDLARRSVIHALMCQFEVSKEAVSVNYLIDFDDYFATELEALRPLEDEGLVEQCSGWLMVTPKGRMLVRTVCMCFDRYLDGDTRRYSRTV